MPCIDRTNRTKPERRDRLKELRIAIWIGSDDIVRGANVQDHEMLASHAVAHAYNDWNNRPQLQGVGHSLPRYFEVHGKEILQFHAGNFGRRMAPRGVCVVGDRP